MFILELKKLEATILSQAWNVFQKKKSGEIGRYDIKSFLYVIRFIFEMKIRVTMIDIETFFHVS